MKTARTYCFLLSACTALLAMPTWADDIPSASGDCVAGILETTPSSGYTLMESGAVVRHEVTGLEWRRCPEGMIWSGSSCVGSATAMTWQEALQHADGVSGWRLPNVKELGSIVERCRVRPAINQQAFPNTPWGAFLSASPSAGASDSAWGVNFDSGNDGLGRKSSVSIVRLVRGGQ
jgi:hypothetical protein